MGVLKSCKPRKEVLQGDLDDAVFAADFGNLITGKALGSMVTQKRSFKTLTLQTNFVRL